MQPHYAVFWQPSVTVAHMAPDDSLPHSFLFTLPASVGRVSSDKLATFVMLMRRCLEEQVETQKSIHGNVMYMQV